jgi:general stress protein YciG
MCLLIIKTIKQMENVHAPANTLLVRKGFAAMTTERRKAIASAGGKAAQKQGVAYKFDAEKAREAGRKGGKAISKNREHMALIGLKGGQARSRKAGLNRYDELIKAANEKMLQNDNINGVMKQTG